MFVDSEIPMAKVLTDAQRDLEWEKWDLHARAQRKKSDKKETRQMMLFMLILLLSYVFVFVAGFRAAGWFGCFLAAGVLTMAATWFYFWLEHTIALERELAQIKEYLHQIR